MKRRKGVLMTLSDWVFSVLAFLFFIWMIVQLVGTGVQWTRSWFDRVNYEKLTGEIAPVIEQVAECSPCEVVSIYLSEHRMKFIVRDEDGHHTQYVMRDKFLDDVNSFRHFDHRTPEENARNFDPRAIDPIILRELIIEARASEPDEWRWTATELRLDRIRNPAVPICFRGGNISRAVDGVSPCHFGFPFGPPRP